MADAVVEVRRLLHCNYNCRVSGVLERFYGGLFDLRSHLRSSQGGAVRGDSLGLYQEISSEVALLYDHRGGRRACSLDLQTWTEPATVGAPYPHGWNCGIQSVGFSHPDLAAVVARSLELGGTLAHQATGGVLLRDPEGVAVEVYQQAGPSEARSIRIVCSDIDRSTDWWERLGFIASRVPGPMPGSSLWIGDDDHRLVEERPMVATDDDTMSVILTRWSGPDTSSSAYGPPFHQGLVRVAMAVDDSHAAHQALHPLGMAVASPHTYTYPGTPLAGGLSVLLVRDPTGVYVDLIERPKSLFRQS